MGGGWGVMVRRWRSWRRRKWWLPVLVALGVLIAIPAGPDGSGAATPTNTGFRARVDQGGVQNVTTVHVTAAGKNPTTYPISVVATTGAANGTLGNTGAAGSSILVTFGAGASGSLCVTALDTSFTIPQSVTFPTSGPGTWTFATRSNGSCGGNDGGGTSSTVDVNYATSASP